MTMAESLSLAPATLAVVDGDLLRAPIFTEHYALPPDDGFPCETTPADRWRHIATGIARVDAPARQHV
jgi:hypothetical protein